MKIDALSTKKINILLYLISFCLRNSVIFKLPDPYIFYMCASARTRRSNSVKLPASFAIERSAKASAKARMKCGGN